MVQINTFNETEKYQCFLYDNKCNLIGEITNCISFINVLSQINSYKVDGYHLKLQPTDGSDCVFFNIYNNGRVDNSFPMFKDYEIQLKSLMGF